MRLLPDLYFISRYLNQLLISLSAAEVEERPLGGIDAVRRFLNPHILGRMRRNRGGRELILVIALSCLDILGKSRQSCPCTQLFSCRK